MSSLKATTIEQSICQLTDEERLYLTGQFYLSLSKRVRLNFIECCEETSTIIYTDGWNSLYPRYCDKCKYRPNARSPTDIIGCCIHRNLECACDNVHKYFCIVCVDEFIQQIPSCDCSLLEDNGNNGLCMKICNDHYDSFIVTDTQ